MLRRLTLVLAVLLAAAPVACAADDDGAAEPASTTTSSAPATSGAPADAGSAGCDIEPVAPGRTVETLTSGGVERSFVRYVPAGDATGPRPLVVDLTAYSPADLEERISGFTVAAADGSVPADEAGAVVVTPEPAGGAGELLTWNLTDQPGWPDDDRFLADVLDQVAADTCVLTDRTVVMGFAIGGVMASRLACTMADEVALLVTVSGLDDPPDCDPARPVPVLAIHGTGDRFLPYDGGVGAGAADLPLSPETTAGLAGVVARRGPVPETAAAWAARDGCADAPTEEDLGGGATLESWEGCDDDAAVELVTLEGGEHGWPGSTTMDDLVPLLGPVSEAVVANDLILDRLPAG